MRFQALAAILLLQPLFCSAAATEQMVISTPQQDLPAFGSSEPTLADLLTLESTASIFFSYARELKLGSILNEDTQITVLVPTNKAVMALARKPHQGPETSDEGIVITDEDFENLSKKNVLRWISAHIIPKSPIEFNSKTYETLLEGKSVEFKLVERGEINAPEWTRVEIDQDIHIVGFKQAANGAYYLIDGAVKVD